LRVSSGRRTRAGRGRIIRIAGGAAVVYCALTGLPRDAAARDSFDFDYPEQAWTRLGTFEAHTLSEADKAFNDKKYREALTRYDAFIAQFMDSPALPYALMRKGRSLQHDNKRFEALREYAEVLDYFPDSVLFAAAAQYYTGQVHWDNGSVEPAMRAWARMVQDADYSQHRLAAHALLALGDNLSRQERFPEAVRYYQQTMEHFRTDRPVREHAIPRVLTHYTRRQPDEGRLREFYQLAGTFHPHRPAQVPDELDEDRDYWGAVIRAVNDNGRFGDDEVRARSRFYAYWAGRLGTRFENWDHYRITLANWQLAADGDRAQWFARMDRQFDAFQEEGDFERIIRWIRIYRDFPEKQDDYYRKFRFEAMTGGQMTDLTRALYESERPDMARNLLERMPYADMSDQAIENLARQVVERFDSHRFDVVCLRMADPDRAKAVLLEFYYRGRQHRHISLSDQQRANCLPLAREMTGNPERARRAWWIKAEFLFFDSEWRAAIAAYRTSDNPTASLFRIAQCFERLDDRERAVQQLAEIETFFPDDAPRAVKEIANVYQRAGDNERQAAALRRVMDRYPQSVQSRNAHVRLQRLSADGVIARIGGGVDAE